jgi:cytochrome c peroxidase
LVGFHKVAGSFNFRSCRGKAKQDEKNKRVKGFAKHFAEFLLVLCAVPSLALAGEARKFPLPPPLTPDSFIAFDPAKARIGQLLFYDKILSGNRNIACNTCHHADHGTSDGLSLGIGEGGIGISEDRTGGEGIDRIAKRIPRNAQALWNLGAREVNVLFHDGRLSKSDLFGNGFNSPAEEWLPRGLTNILSAQALFPMVAQFEMAGNPKENEIAGAVHDRIDAAWPILAKRVRTIPEYGKMFVEAFADVKTPEDVSIVEMGEALGAFMGLEWQSHDSPFDQWLAGDQTALSQSALAGLELFFGKANCASCHSGALFTDQDFHALALPQFGPGRTRNFDPMPRDLGRMAESDALEDAYRFRTPSLRNVALTGPYGHNGAYGDLEGIIRHHLNPAKALARWQSNEARLPPLDWFAKTDFLIRDDQRETARLAARIDIEPVDLDEREISDLIAFLNALTGRTSLDGRLGTPQKVPSGLPID